jgi:hypothetical protein
MDPPVAIDGGCLLCVERHVRAVETADADMEDARNEGLAVVARDRQT